MESLLATNLKEKTLYNTHESRQNLLAIERLDSRLLQHFKDKLIVKTCLTRQLVSFQANKTRASYRWFKYKEAFSASLIEYLLKEYGIASGKIFDPFAGIGTTLFAASDLGLDADGIELLPIGQQIINTRLCLEREFTSEDFNILTRWANELPWEKSKLKLDFSVLRITKGAYDEETLDHIKKYLGALKLENVRVQAVLRFALLCILESISFTRKDGQYLRWDYRSDRKQGKKRFDKGKILKFKDAIRNKIHEIVRDLEAGVEHQDLFPVKKKQGRINLLNGSCLNIMSTIRKNSYSAIITSPPYCNRYDYTRTYALELALLGVDEQELTHFRQLMLSCTVENRAKDLLSINKKWADAIKAADEQELLQGILNYLEIQKKNGNLNNNGIPRMVRGYFYEMACIISECARIMKPNAIMCMVNDNVRYAGASISVDMILSSIAEKLGFEVKNILVLPNGKGNSSQQMGEHGRIPMRKCIYVWRKV